jgi:hypothetical protein
MMQKAATFVGVATRLCIGPMLNLIQVVVGPLSMMKSKGLSKTCLTLMADGLKLFVLNAMDIWDMFSKENGLRLKT